MRYYRIEDYRKWIFGWIRGMVYEDRQKPFYEEEPDGLNALEHVLEAVSNNDYYSDAYAKGAYLFVSLSTGHHFSNGNKRLGFASAIHFFLENGFNVKSIHEDTYQKWFKRYFPNYHLSKNDYRRVAGWAIMNLNLAINIKEESHLQKHTYSFSELKDIVADFFRIMFGK